MQTFVPLSKSYAANAAILDMRRLGKQRVEVLQIYNTLMESRTGHRRGWAAHPAVRMWAGSEFALLIYGIEMCKEWRMRGYNDIMLNNFIAKLGAWPDAVETYTSDNVPLPWWWGDDRVHSSHRRSLLLKDPQWYGRYGWTDAPDNTYYWPGEPPK